MPKSKLNDDDKALFRESVRGIKPLTHSKISLRPAPPKHLPHITPIKEKTPELALSDEDRLDPVESDERLHFHHPGLSHKILRKLREGQYTIELRLDLHGMTVECARSALSSCLIHAAEHGIRHILVIHGKGHSNHTPILKNKLNHWLRQTEHVLAFCSATPKHGSSGAVYVLLKRMDK